MNELRLESKPAWADEIPGLRWFGPGPGVLKGPADAIAAAYVRLEPTAAQFDIDLPKATPVKDERLRAYQQVGVGELLARLDAFGGAILGDDMGLGKTRQAIKVAETLTDALKGRALVVVPALARETWLAELLRWGVKEETIALVMPDTTRRTGAFRARLPSAQWVITSYELLERALDEGFVHELPAVLLVDEAHMLKGRDTKGNPSKRARLVEEIAMMVPRKLLITGTPMADRPRDLYNLLRVITGGKRVFGTPWDFDRAYCAGGRGAYGWENKGVSNAEELRRRLELYMVRREKREVAAELPSLTRQRVWLDPDEKGLAAFRTACLRKSGGDVQNALVATLEAKIPAALSLAAEARKFLLLTWLKDHAKQMFTQLNKTGTPCLLITGENSTSQREKIAQEAAEQGIGVVATLDSVWQAIDSLKKVASIGIMHALRHQWLMMAQGEARLHRIGQPDPVQWLYLACRDTMDEIVMRQVVDKMDQFRAVMASSDEATALRDTLAHEDETLQSLYEAMP